MLRFFLTSLICILFSAIVVADPSPAPGQTFSIGTNNNLDCPNIIKQNKDSLGAAIRECNAQSADDDGKSQMTFQQCYNNYGDCGTVPTSADDLEGMSTACKKSMANDLFTARSKDFDTLKTATDQERGTEDKLNQAMKDEADAEASIKTQITQLQTSLADFIETQKENLENLLNMSKDQISQIETDIQNAKSDEQQIANDRITAIDDAKTALDTEKASCADAVACQVQSGSMSQNQCSKEGNQYGFGLQNPFGGFNLTTTTALGCIGAGGLANCACQNNRHALNNRMKVLRDMNAQLAKLNTAMAKERNDIANMQRKAQSVMSKMSTAQQQTLRQIAMKTQSTQQQIQNLLMQLQQKQQAFQQQMAMLQRQKQQDDGIVQSATQDFQQANQGYNVLKTAGYIGSGSSSSDPQATHKEDIAKAAENYCFLQAQSQGSGAFDMTTCQPKDDSACLSSLKDRVQFATSGANGSVK